MEKKYDDDDDNTNNVDDDDDNNDMCKFIFMNLFSSGDEQRIAIGR